MNIRFYNARILSFPTDTKEAEGKKENAAFAGNNHRFDLIQGELWVRGNRIAYIGDGSDLLRTGQKENAAKPLWDREIDAGGNVLMPGFKNAHTHTAMTFLRSYADDLPLQEWLHNQVFPKEAQLTQEDMYHLCKLGIMEYLTSGITSNFDMYFAPLPCAKATADCGFRSVFTSGLNDFCQSLPEVEELYHTIREMSGRTGFVMGFHAEYTTSLQLMEGLAALAEKVKSPVWLHNSETAREVNECRQRWGKTPTQLTDELGMYAYGGGGYHCIYLEDADFEIFKHRGLTAVTNPASNLKLASGIAPVKRFLEEGIPVAIGTDGPASNNCLDMFREMFLVSGLAKVREQDALCIPAEEVLSMATVEGAHAMGLWECDALEEGKLADLIMIDLKQPNMQPENHFVKNIVYSGSKQNVRLTMVDGNILYEDQKFFIGTDPNEVYRRANEIIRRMQ
ncbi:5-methylthioadenosine/S-adenosylhomocysteine deaminase [Lachnospiraceae bacterium]|nr:amidohydrolase [Eubacterium sp.]GFI25620.1 5-methylthioadenosine/S-adenosylhomocysteine deaminase [Lachnospiraceae bacterium]